MCSVQKALRLCSPRFGFRTQFSSSNKTSWNLLLSRNISSQYKRTVPHQFGQQPSVEPQAWVLLVIPVSAFLLGTWQVKRKFWKEDLIEHMHRRLHRNPIPLPQTMEEIDKLDYCPVVMKGVFDHSRELYLGPRSQVNVENHKGSSGGGIFSKSQAGYNVVTAFKPSDRDYYILVNRGWVPADRKNPAHRSEGQVTGEVTIKGIIRLAEKRAPFMAKNFPEKNAWLFRDVDKMAEVADTAPIFVDAAEDSWVPGGPIGGQTNLAIRNEHLSYIVTWYSLSAITGYMWFKKYIQPTIRHGRFR